MCKCGEIVLVAYPFTDDTGTKVRPVLVVSVDQFNQGEDVVVVPISSVAPTDETYVFPVRDTAPFFRQTGLRESSFVKWTKPLTLSTTIVHRRLGLLSSEPLIQVQTRIRGLFAQ